MIDFFMILISISSALALVFALRCLILIFVNDYEAWKREKEKKRLPSQG